MAIRTLTSQERYSKNRGGGTEQRKKLKKLRSVKVANLDRFRLSMRREKTRFDPTGSGTSSPNYMKATTSSASRINHGRKSNQASTENPSSKFSKIYVEQCSDPAGVDIPVDIKSGKSFKRVSSLRKSEKISSLKSMKFRTKYSQFLEFDDNGVMNSEESMVREGTKQKGILERSRSIRMTRLRSIRSSRRVKSRFSGGKTMEASNEGEMSCSEPRYMKGTSSQEARKNSAKGLTRTTSLRPLRILAKIPSLRPRRNKVRKQPEFTPLPGINLNRATCSSTLKRSKVHPWGRESEGSSSFHVCPYSYCSLHGHHHNHNATYPPLKEFISGKRQLLDNQKGKQLVNQSGDDEVVVHSTSVVKTNPSVQIVAAESLAAEEMINVTRRNVDEVEDDTGVDYLIKIYAKPRKKWVIEGTPIEDETSMPEARQEPLIDGQPKSYWILELPDNDPKSASVGKSFEAVTGEEIQSSVKNKDSEVSPGGDLLNFLSDKQYTSMWHLIHQQLVSTEASMAANEEMNGADADTWQEMNSSEKTAINLVQEALTALLQNQKSIQDQEEFREDDEVVGKEDEVLKMGGISPTLQQKTESNEGKMPGKEMSKSYSKLRKMIMTAKFIKAMERLRKISPCKPQHLSSESATEKERVYLRHLSMNGRKNDEEWMLDYALRQAISRLAPAQQRQVGLLIGAFETVTPEHKEKGFRCYPMKGEADASIETEQPISNEQVPVQKQDGEILLSPAQGVLEETGFGDAGAARNNTTGDEILLESDKTDISHSTLEASRSYSGSDFIDIAFQESSMGNEESMRTLEVPSQFSTQDDMTTLLSDNQKYQGMWNLIYQHVQSSQESTDAKTGVNGFDEKEQSGSRVMTDEDEDNQSAACKDHEFNQSAAIKLVKEAVNAILQQHEQSSDHRSIPDHDRVNESKTSQKKFSKSYSKLKRAIITAKFIKAIERLRKINPNKPQHLYLEAASEQERVYLRHLSMDGRKNSEEWMLDYALRQAISKLAPDQQRKVALLAEAFETVTPEQKEKNIRCYPSKGEPAPGIRLANPTIKSLKQFVEFGRERSILDQQGSRKHEICTSQERIYHEDHDHQVSITGETIQRETNKDAVSYSNLELSEDGSESASDEVAVIEVRSQSPTGESEISIADDMTIILSDKQKYTSMWHLIYQHVKPSEAPITVEEATNGVDEAEQGDAANKCHEMNGLDSTQSMRELDQSAAIKLVKEAINAILQCNKISDEKSLKDHNFADGNGEESLNEVKNSKVNSSKSYSKLKKLITTTKFIKAMERLRRTSPRKAQYLSPEGASKEESVCLRHKNTNQKRNVEELMLDYALRNVISNLAPDRQRRVALLVKAYDSIANGKQIFESEKDDSTSSNASIPQQHEEDRFNLLGKGAQLERGVREDHPIEISNLRLESQDKVLDSDSNNLHIHHQVSPRVRKEETGYIPMSESLQQACSNTELKQESEPNTGNGLFGDSQKNTTMWHLIYQHVKSVTVADEAGSKQGEKMGYDEDQMNPASATTVTTADANADDDDTSSVVSELAESDAIKLVKEAINDILNAPQELDNELHSTNITGAAVSEEDLRAGVGEKSEKSLSRGYSKLRKLILCNKFIKAMEKKRELHPQKRKNLKLESSPEAEKAHLNPCGVSEKKRSNDWMLDNALQKVIAGLAPVQQRRVSMLVKAFEKVNPDLEETNKGFGCITIESVDGVSSTGNEKLEESVVTSRSMEVFTNRVPTEFNEERSPTSSKENATSIQDWRNDGTELQVKSSKPEESEDKWNGSTDNNVSTSLWCLLVKHIKSDVSEEVEKKIPCEIDANSHVESVNILLQSNNGRGMDVQTPRSISFEFQEKEAIKLVQEALDEILLPDKTSCDDQTMITSATTDQEGCNENTSQEEKSINGYKQLSKVILCKRFIKAMDKMRKLKPQSLPNHAQKHSEEEIRQSKHHVVTTEKKTWEEWMLDHAMQEVVGKLAPAQKKKVALLVQAFEAVGSQPDPSTS